MQMRGGGEIVADPTLFVRFEPYLGDYQNTVDTISEIESIPPKLVSAVLQVSSGCNPKYRSDGGRIGLMRLAPDDLQRYGVQDPYNPESNIRAGVKRLRAFLEVLPVALALAAYYTDEANVVRFNGIPPDENTRTFVTEVLSIANR